MTSGRLRCRCRGPKRPWSGIKSSFGWAGSSISHSAETSCRWASPFPRTRAALVATHPEKFFMPIQSDLRYNWVQVWLDAIDQTETRELVVNAWRMVVPKRVAAEHLDDHS